MANLETLSITFAAALVAVFAIAVIGVCYAAKLHYAHDSAKRNNQAQPQQPEKNEPTSTGGGGR